jgi:hypothetical protein
MRKAHFLPLLAALAALASSAQPGAGDSPKPSETAAVSLPGPVVRGVVRGDHFFAVTTNGRFIDVDLKERQVKDLGTFDLKLEPFVDVRDKQACVATKDDVYIVDLGTRKAKATTLRPTGVRGLGFLSDKQIFVQTDKAVIIKYDTCWGTTRTLVKFESKDDRTGATTPAHHLADGRLFVTSGVDGKLAVIDVRGDKPVQFLDTPHWRLGGVHVVGDKAYIVGLRLGYGVYTTSFGSIDIKTSKFTEFKGFPMYRQGVSTVMSGPDGSLLLSGSPTAYQFDNGGKTLGSVSVGDGGQVVGTWNGQVLTAAKESLQVVKVESSPK